MMLRKLMLLALCMSAVGIVALYHVESAQATTASGFKGVSMLPTDTFPAGLATFQDFQVFNLLTRSQLQTLAPTYPGNTWWAFERTEGPSDLYLLNNTWQPGGSTGWHKHPGHSLIVITSGQVTQYHADCKPEVYGPGTPNGPTLVDSGNDEHLIRNESAGVATGIAVQLVANGAPRRIDVVTAPPTCPLQ